MSGRFLDDEVGLLRETHGGAKRREVVAGGGCELGESWQAAQEAAKSTKDERKDKGLGKRWKEEEKEGTRGFVSQSRHQPPGFKMEPSPAMSMLHTT